MLTVLSQKSKSKQSKKFVRFLKSRKIDGISIHYEEMSQAFLKQQNNESSDEEEEFNQNSPRKRRFRSKIELEEFHGPTNQHGFLQVETFCLQDFDWFEPIENILKSVKNSELDILSESSKAEFTLDLSTLELNQVVKHRKSTEDSDEDEEDEETEDPVPSTSNTAQADPNFKVPKPKCRKFIFKPFKRTPEGLEHDETKDPVEVTIPEQLAASYGLYLWPSAPVLAWYLWLRQDDFVNKKVLELGSGTALPGLLAAKIGTAQVTLSDDAWQVNTIKNILEAVKINGLEEPKVQVKGITWGDYTEELFEQTNLDFIIGSDLFFDPEVFEPLLITIAWLLECNPQAEVLIAVQERSSDWCLEEHLLKWKLKCSYIYPKDFLQGTGLEETDLTGKHSIFILKIFSSSQ